MPPVKGGATKPKRKSADLQTRSALLAVNPGQAESLSHWAARQDCLGLARPSIIKT